MLERGDIRAVIVNNEAVDDEVLPGHRAGYSGLASLTHSRRRENLFVPAYAGLNFEHIHDGTVQPREILFEPRQAPMTIRRRSGDMRWSSTSRRHRTGSSRAACATSWSMTALIEMTLECIPRARTFKNDYIGLFFASYIHQPESLDIHFLGVPAGEKNAEPQWIRGVTPSHGVLATHLAVDDGRSFPHDPDFPLSLVFNESNHRYSEPWYYGVSHGMAFVQMFRPRRRGPAQPVPLRRRRGQPGLGFPVVHPEVRGRPKLSVRHAGDVPAVRVAGTDRPSRGGESDQL